MKPGNAYKPIIWKNGDFFFLFSCVVDLCFEDIDVSNRGGDDDETSATSKSSEDVVEDGYKPLSAKEVSPEPKETNPREAVRLGTIPRHSGGGKKSGRKTSARGESSDKRKGSSGKSYVPLLGIGSGYLPIQTPAASLTSPYAPSYAPMSGGGSNPYVPANMQSKGSAYAVGQQEAQSKGNNYAPIKFVTLENEQTQVQQSVSRMRSNYAPVDWKQTMEQVDNDSPYMVLSNLQKTRRPSTVLPKRKVTPSAPYQILSSLDNTKTVPASYALIDQTTTTTTDSDEFEDYFTEVRMGDDESSDAETSDSDAGIPMDYSDFKPEAMKEVMRLFAEDYGISKCLKIIQEHIEEEEQKMFFSKIRKVSRMGAVHPDIDNSSKWQFRFEDALQAGNLTAIHNCANEFIHTARVFGEIIISESSLPTYLKTIKPVMIGGIAGGEKFIVSGILFKFSDDVVLEGVYPTLYMYGGKTPNPEAAQKAAGHERKGNSEIQKRALYSGVNAPLMTLVDFRGSRLSAQSLLPIDVSTIIYGSSTAGRRIAAGESNEKALLQLNKLAEHLHLAEHDVLESSTSIVKQLRFPVDIEIHRSLLDDTKHYVVDTARLFPPMVPDDPHQVYYQLFRPEFLSYYASIGKPALSSDAFSRFGMLNWKKHNADIVEATRHLLDVRVKEAATALLESETLDKSCKTMHLSRRVQQYGVNCRFLGLVRNAINDDGSEKAVFVRTGLLREMIARILQKRIRAMWRDVGVGVALSPYEDVAREALNNIIQADTDPDWLVINILRKYGELALGAKYHGTCLLDLCGRESIVSIVCEIAGIVLARDFRIGDGERLTKSDLRLEPRVKKLNTLAVFEAEAIRLEAKDRSTDRQLALLRRARGILEMGVVGDPRDFSLRVRLVRVMYEELKSGKRFAQVEALEKQCMMLPDLTADRHYFIGKLRRLQCQHAIARYNAADAVEYWYQSRVATCRIADINEENYLIVSKYQVKKLYSSLLDDFLRVINVMSCYQDCAHAAKLTAFFEEGRLIDAARHVKQSEKHSGRLMGVGMFLVEDNIASVSDLGCCRGPTLSWVIALRFVRWTICWRRGLWASVMLRMTLAKGSGSSISRRFCVMILV